MCPRTACTAATVEETVHEPLQQLVGVREAVSGILEVLSSNNARAKESGVGEGHARGGGEGGGGVLSEVDRALLDLCSRRGAFYDTTMLRDNKMQSDAGGPQADGRAREEKEKKEKIEKNSGGTHKSERGQGAERGEGGVTLWNEGAAAGGGEDKKKEEETEKEVEKEQEEEKEKVRAGGGAFDSADKCRRNLQHLGNLENLQAPHQVLTLLALLVQ
jgi:hypothetical protein